jgi:glycosyltransferase involved in cell wall biosynthesis
MAFKLSIIIPTYNYSVGLQRILRAVLVERALDLEIIISDDSTEDGIMHLVDEYSLSCPGTVVYRRNQPPLGAVHNWNSLLEMSTGEFVLLMHHDEYPFNEYFVQNAIDLISCYANQFDVFVFDCILVSCNGLLKRPHLPGFIRKFVLQSHPSYLLKRNVIGPTSCLLVRRSLYPRFDVSLRWLVDVDLYVRLRSATSRWLFCNEVKICSTLGRLDSITASIKHDLQKLNEGEREYLLPRHPGAVAWLSPKGNLFSNTIERLAWVGMRGITRSYYGFLGYCICATVFMQKFLLTFRNDHS